jgi:glycosyltransferase involved in cell wall biosynthesis
MGDEVRSRVAVVIPAYNGAQFLADAVASVRDQGDVVDELVVVDNASTDDTARVAAALGVRVVDEPRPGAGLARRAGLAATKADALLFLDCDDLLEPGAVAALCAALRETGADFVHGMLENRVLPGLEGRFRFPEGPVSAPLASASVVRRDVFDRFGPFGDDDFSWAAWYEQAQTRGLRIATIPDLVCVRRIHGANTTITSGTYAPYFDLIRARLRSRSETS